MGNLILQQYPQVNNATFNFFESGNQINGANYPHGTLLLNNKLYVSTNYGQFVVLNDVKGNLSDVTSINVGLGAMPDLTYDSNTNRIYGIGTSIFYINPSNLSVTTTSIPGGNANASITNDGTHLYIAPGNPVGIIKKYRISDHQFVENYIFNPAGTIHAIRMSPDNQYVLGTVAALSNPPSAPNAPAGFMVRAKVSDSSTSTFQYNNLIPSDPLYGLAVNATDDLAIINKNIFIGDEYNRNAAIINWETLTLIKSIDLNVQDLGTYCWFASTDGRYVIFGARRNKIYIYDSILDIGKIFSLPVSLSPVQSINECIYIGDSTWIATNYAENFRFFRFKINLTKNSGSISIEKQNIKSISVLADIPSDFYIFLGGSNNTIGNFLNTSELTGNNSFASADRISVYDANLQTFVTYFLRGDGVTWRKIGETTSQNNLIIENNSIIRLTSASYKTFTMQGTNLIQKQNIGNGQIGTLPFSFDQISLYIIGDFTDFISGLNSNVHIIKIFLNAQEDTSFDNSNSFIPSVNVRLSDIKRKPMSNKLYISGLFSAYKGSNINNLMILNEDGSLDLSLSINSINNEISSFDFQEDKIIIVGGFDLINGQTQRRIARLNSDGSLDLTFNTTTTSGSYLGFGASAVRKVVVTPNNKIYVIGNFSFYSGTFSEGIIRLDSTGYPDNTFDVSRPTTPGVFGLRGEPYELILLDNNRILVAGSSFSFYRSHPDLNNIIIINENGSLDTSFTARQFDINAVVYSVVKLENGQFLVGGDFTTYDGVTVNGIIKINSDGSLDTGFNDGGTGFSGAQKVKFIKLIRNSKIFVGGSFTSYNGISTEKAVVLNLDGSIYKTFSPGFQTGGISSAIE